MAEGTPKEANESNIHEPLSSYYPSLFQVDSPTLQNLATAYFGHGSVYNKKEGRQGENSSTHRTVQE